MKKILITKQKCFSKFELNFKYLHKFWATNKAVASYRPGYFNSIHFQPISNQYYYEIQAYYSSPPNRFCLSNTLHTT